MAKKRATSKAKTDTSAPKRPVKSNLLKNALPPCKKQAQTGNRGQFAPGTSGNPAGRKPGVRNRTNAMVEQLIDSEREAIVQAVINGAKALDPTCVAAVMKVLYTPRKSRPIEIKLPEIAGASDLLAAHDSIIEAVSQGTLTPDEGNQLSELLKARCELDEMIEIQRRLDGLEAALGLHNSSNRTS